MYIKGNLVLEPSCNSLIESIKSNCPKFHDEYWSLNISVTVSSKSLINCEVFKNLSVTNPTGLNTSPTLKLYPVLSNSKFLIVNEVDPIPTVVVAAPTSNVRVTPVPVSVVDPIPLLETPVIGRLE